MSLILKVKKSLHPNTLLWEKSWAQPSISLMAEAFYSSYKVVVVVGGNFNHLVYSYSNCPRSKLDPDESNISKLLRAPLLP